MFLHGSKEKSNLRLVVQEVVSQIVANVSKDTTTKDCSGSVPVIEENSVSEVPEGCSKRKEQGWRHDQAQPVHG